MYVDELAYCLVPNHFHFLVFTHGDFNQLEFSHDLRIMLSSYTRAINKPFNIFSKKINKRCDLSIFPPST